MSEWCHAGVSTCSCANRCSGSSTPTASSRTMVSFRGNLETLRDSSSAPCWVTCSRLNTHKRTHLSACYLIYREDQTDFNCDKRRSVCLQGFPLFPVSHCPGHSQGHKAQSSGLMCVTWSHTDTVHHVLSPHFHKPTHLHFLRFPACHW